VVLDDKGGEKFPKIIKGEKNYEDRLGIDKGRGLIKI
jgi:hypothetical protein